jgi:hypothetical protein
MCYIWYIFVVSYLSKLKWIILNALMCASCDYSKWVNTQSESMCSKISRVACFVSKLKNSLLHAVLLFLIRPEDAYKHPRCSHTHRAIVISDKWEQSVSIDFHLKLLRAKYSGEDVGSRDAVLSASAKSILNKIQFLSKRRNMRVSWAMPMHMWTRVVAPPTNLKGYR